MGKTLIYLYKCPDCEGEFAAHEQIRYCNRFKCRDKDNELKLITTVEEGKVLSWSNGKEWGEIHHPDLGNVMTYWKAGTPCYDTYTAPMVDACGDIYCYRFDQDEGYWIEDTLCLGSYNGIDTCKFA